MSTSVKQTIKKDLISMVDITPSELFEILSIAKELKSKPFLKSDKLINKTIALIFAKPSLRTRMSFEVGISQLGGHAITIKMDEISIGTREDTNDIANVLSRYVSGIVIRTYEQNQIADLGKSATIPVINGLSNEEHPCQVISDLFTIKEVFNDFSRLKLAFIGDGNNIVHSLLICAALANFHISVATPKSYEPKNQYVEMAKKINPNIKLEITNDPYVAAKDANVLYTDTWVSMGQEQEINKRIKIFEPYQINDDLLSIADKDTIVLHCLPAHKDQEITSKVFERFSKIIYTQAENRLHAQKAILLKLIGE